MNSSYLSIQEDARVSLFSMRKSKKFEFEILEYEKRNQLAKERWRKVPRLRNILGGLQRTTNVADDIEILLLLRSPTLPENASQNQRKKFVIYPTDKWKIIFDFIVGFLILYFCCRIPYKIGFNDKSMYIHEDLFEVIIGFDIIFHFFSAYNDNGQIIDNLKMISLNYLKGMLIFDLLAILPLYLADDSLLWLKLARLLRLYDIFDKLESYITSLTRTFNFLEKYRTKKLVLNLMKFFIYTTIICHVMACFWHFIVLNTNDDPSMWNELTRGEAYMTSLYFILVTFAIVGYGDVVPITNAQIGYTIFAEFIGILIFARLMGNISEIITSIRLREKVKTDKKDDLDKWMIQLVKGKSDKRLPEGIKTDVNRFYANVWDDDRSMLVNNDFMLRLPYKLRTDMYDHLFSDEIYKYDCFFRECNYNFCYAIASRLYMRKFEANEIIIRKDAAVDCIFLINKGMVYLATEKSNTKFRMLPKYSFFGDEYVIYSSKPSMNYIAGDNGCELQCITKKDFKRISKLYPKTFKILASKAFKRALYFRSLSRISTPFSERCFTKRKGIERMIKSDVHALKIIKKYDEGKDSMSSKKIKKMKKLLKQRNHQEETTLLRFVQNFYKMLDKFEKMNDQVGEAAFNMEDMNQQILGEIETINLALDNFENTGNLKRILEFLESNV